MVFAGGTLRGSRLASVALRDAEGFNGGTPKIDPQRVRFPHNKDPNKVPKKP